MVDIRKLTAADLQSLLRGPLGRLRIAVPSLDECTDLVIWVRSGPCGPIELPRVVSDRPSRDLSALRKSMEEVEAHWDRVFESSTLPNAGDVHSGYVVQPLAKLRDALNAYERLIPQNSQLSESWEDAAVSLAIVLKWIVQRSGSNVHSGLSKGGPSMTFIMDGLRKLGWASHATPTEDSVVQSLKRYKKRSERDGDITI